MPERARGEPTFIARSNSEPSRLASRPDQVVLYCDTITFISYYVIDLFFIFYGSNARYSLKYIYDFLVYIFYFIYNKNK